MTGLRRCGSSSRPIAGSVDQRPRVSALARVEAARGSEISSSSHENLSFSEPLARELIKLLDGSRDLDSLSRDLAQAAVALGEPEAPPSAYRDSITAGLEGLARVAMLESQEQDRTG